MSRGRGTVDASASIRQPCQYVVPVAGYPRSDTELRYPTPTKRRSELRLFSPGRHHKILAFQVQEFEKIQKKSIGEKNHGTE